MSRVAKPNRQLGGGTAPPGRHWPAAPAGNGLPRPPSPETFPRSAGRAPRGYAPGGKPLGRAKVSRNGSSAGATAGYSGSPVGVSRSGSSAGATAGYSGSSVGVSRSGSSASVGATAGYSGSSVVSRSGSSASAGATAGYSGSSVGVIRSESAAAASPGAGRGGRAKPPPRDPVSPDGPPPPRPPKPGARGAHSSASSTAVAGHGSSRMVSPEPQPESAYMEMNNGADPQHDYMSMNGSKTGQYMTVNGPETERQYTPTDADSEEQDEYVVMDKQARPVRGPRAVSPALPARRNVNLAPPLGTRAVSPARSVAGRRVTPEPPATGAYRETKSPVEELPSPPSSLPSPPYSLPSPPYSLSPMSAVRNFPAPAKDQFGSCGSLASIGSATSLQERSFGGDHRAGPKGAQKRGSTESDPGCSCLVSWPWQHDVNRQRAEELLRGRPDGWFLVRPTQDAGAVSTLSVSLAGTFRHLHVRRRGDRRLALGQRKGDEAAFETIESLIEYHRHHPLVVKGAAAGCRLTGNP